MSLLYCYGVVKNPALPAIVGFEGQKVYCLKFKEISAVAGNVTPENFSQEVIDQNVKDLKWLAKYGKIHESVVHAVMQKTTIIPMKFCTIFNSKQHVESMLEERYADFMFNLSNLESKVEMGVKVYFDAGPLRQKVMRESNEIKAIEKNSTGKKPGAAYFDKQKIEVLVKELVQQHIAKHAEIIFGSISAIDKKKNDLLDKKLTGKHMMLNAVFLINKEGVEKFRKEIQVIKTQPDNLDIEIWGPFAPYNFVR